jgi:SpoIVB peptidase S55
MRGIGKTVFSGDRIEDFQVEILGVLENIAPRQSLILARISGGPIGTTNVMQGMSGSPVYIDGRLVGAVAMAFPFSKEPIAGIRPIADMLSAPDKAPPRVKAGLTDADVLAALPKRGEAMFGESRMIDIATPISFGGFTRAAIERFSPQLRALGLEPLQGVSGGGRIPAAMGPRSALQPGSMISVSLVTGDLSMGADGTVTYIDGERVYAFGHRFLSVGSTDLPFARSEVLALLPSISSSFKISTPRELMGAISLDQSTAISGELGRRAAMVPVSIRVAGPKGKQSSYQMEIVDDRFLSPFLLQMSVFSAIDATERTVGSGSFLVKGQIEFRDGSAPVRLDNMFTGDGTSAMQVAQSASIPLAYVLQGGFDTLRVKQVALEIESFDEKKQLQIDSVFASRREVRPGEPIELTVGLVGENGAVKTRKVVYPTPIGLGTGPLYFTVSDAGTANVTDFRQTLGATPRSAGQLISNVNNLKVNSKAYVRVWRPDAAYQLHGEDYPAPPPSLSMILARSQSGYGGLTQTFNSKLAELEIDGIGEVVTGSKTIQVDIKE